MFRTWNKTQRKSNSLAKVTNSRMAYSMFYTFWHMKCVCLLFQRQQQETLIPVSFWFILYTRADAQSRDQTWDPRNYNVTRWKSPCMMMNLVAACSTCESSWTGFTFGWGAPWSHNFLRVLFGGGDLPRDGVLGLYYWPTSSTRSMLCALSS